MFEQLNINNTENKNEISSTKTDDLNCMNKYKTILNLTANESFEMNYNTIDKILEREKQNNKSETWNKLDKTIKIQKLHAFAEKYGKEHNFPIKDIKSLKLFFIDCLEKNKIQKAKDVNYDKESRSIISIPSLYFNNNTRNFSLKITYSKRVSTIKSLTPKRSTPTCDPNKQT